jgi:YaiO family outer membrane protein
VDNVDTAFERTRTLAFEGKYDRAIALAQSILDEAPQYHGVRIFLGRMHAWNGRYAEADTALRRVLAADPDHKRAWQARIEVARWGENYEQALAFTAAALQRVATAEAFYLEQARVHLALDAPRKAGLAVDEAERLNPTHPDIAALRRQIQTGRLRYTLTLAGTHDRFSELFDAWTQGYAQLTRQTPLGSVIGRVNVASRFGSSGIQTQLDWYPSIADGIYGYLNVGVSGSALYPSFRFGAEPYVGLPRALEASAGLRYLNFDGSRVLIFTGSLSKYYGNWLFTARTFLTPSEVGVSNSYTLRARRYIAGSRHYVQLQSGFGFSPEERRFQAQPGTLVLLRSQSVAFSYNRPLAYNLLVFGSVGVSREERQIVDGSLLITTVNAGISYRF